MSRRLTPRGEQRRSELLTFATERFAANGYHPTSVAELVDGLGVGKGVFYWYFESKEDLFMEILRSGERELRTVQQAAMTGISDPLERLESAIRSSMHWWSDHRDLYTLIEFAAAESSFAEDLRKGQRVALADTRRLVEAAMEAGSIAEADAGIVAQATLGVSSVLARTELLHRGRPADEVADAVIDFCWNGLLGARPTSTRRSA